MSRQSNGSKQKWLDDGRTELRWCGIRSGLARTVRPPGVRPRRTTIFCSESSPFGAHIRRANPRESFTPVSPDPALEFLAKQSGANPYSSLSPTAQLELSITNRHRIVRVGRHYDPQDALTKPGLMFMCLNVDIERQFEFVQKTWLLGSSFEGLDAEVDPVLGQRTESDVLTIPTPCGPLRVKGLKDFVTVKGSGYFFLPSKKAIRFLSY
jgi:deferrochelatase/peroxidase EfeB